MINNYRKQIVELAIELNCDVHQDAMFVNYGMMYPEHEPKPYVECPIIYNQIDYLINLHELGHVAHKHTVGRTPYQHKDFYYTNGVLKSEAEAWNWALDKCLDDVQLSSRIFMWDVCLGSYYTSYMLTKGRPARLHNGNRQDREFLWDHPTEFFTSTVKRIQGDLIDFKIKYIGRVSF